MAANTAKTTVSRSLIANISASIDLMTYMYMYQAFLELPVVKYEVLNWFTDISQKDICKVACTSSVMAKI